MLRSVLARYRNALVIVAASLLTGAVTLHLLSPVPAPNLAQSKNAGQVLALTQSWAKGDVIALVRHGERCDRTTTPCLGLADGITVHGEVVVQELGANFRQLGL